MSGPFVYNAPGPAYNTATYPSPFAQTTPFIPPTPLHASPYSNTASLPGSPRIGGITHASQLHNPPAPTHEERIVYPNGAVEVTQTYGNWPGAPRRKRTISWHGERPVEYNEFLLPNADPETYYRRDRRGSFSYQSPREYFSPPAQSARDFFVPPAVPDNQGTWAIHTPGGGQYSPSNWGTWHTPLPAASPTAFGFAMPLAIHPYLNGQQPRSDFIFDLSSPSFSPQRLVSPHIPPVAIGTDELSQPVSNPPITRMRIVCDLVPQWPIDFVHNSYGNPYSAGGPNPSPITLGDVLIVLHQNFLRRIGHIDWARLGTSEEAVVSRSYRKRCAAHAIWGNEAEVKEKNDGVKRVDFLLGKVMVRGLTRLGRAEDGAEVVSLILSHRN